MKKKLKKTKKRIQAKRSLNRNQLLPFAIGIAALIILALLIYKYSMDNNYKQVLGNKSEYSQEEELQKKLLD